MSHFKYKQPIKSHLLTKERDSLVLGRGNDINQQINKDVINILQSVAWELNEDILDDLHDVLKPADEPLTAFELKDRREAFRVRDIETSNVIQYLLDNGNKFYFGWKYDKRGRSYSQGYHINPQGNQYRKAMLQFADKEVLTEDGKQHLLMDIANTFGYDKLTWFKRSMKANAIVKDIFSDMRSYSRKLNEYCLEADDSMLFRKAINAWKRGVKEGQPIGHNMGYDGTASGLQFMGAMAGCPVTARNSNVHAKVERTMKEEAQIELDKLEAELASLN